ncbi:MAG: chorismate mutase [Defluviitaleaceae bacterium]|nr:chorismate mutase [Defluviitaleaceae bacterium]
MNNLTELRAQVDKIDDELLLLFEKRMNIVSEITDYKKANGLPILNRAREEEKLNTIWEKSSAPLKRFTRHFYSGLFNLSRKYQHENYRQTLAPIKDYSSALCKEISDAKTAYAAKDLPATAMLACQGVEGSFAQLAAERLFREPPAIQYMKNYDSVFAAIESGLCEYGVLPLMNSTAGSVNKVYRAMKNHNFRIVRSIRLKIDHHLVAQKGVKIGDIREVVSHEQALAQCDGYLTSLSKSIGAEISQTQHNNTAAAAEMVASSTRRDVAAICSRRCVEQYGLEILGENIQDNVNNYTRFILISKNLEIYEGASLTDMILTLENKQGSLYNIIKIVNELGIDMSKLESRPTESDDEFMFYVTFKTLVNDDLFTLFDRLTESCKSFEYLGSYAEL